MSDVEPTARELEALKLLWSRCEAGAKGATVREVCEGVSGAAGEELAYTTILSLLQVMEQKGLVDHVRHGRAYIYRPLIERKKTFRRLAGDFLVKVFDGAIDQYLVHAIENRKLSSQELDQLESMIAQARQQQRQSESPRSPSAPKRQK